jgi:hypothetical protein
MQAGASGDVLVRVPTQVSGTVSGAASPRVVLQENTAPARGRVTLVHRGALVVFEGASRVGWHRGTSAEWTPVSLWPQPHEADALAAHLARRDPLLVVLRERVATVPVFREELDRSDPVFAALADSAEDDPVELRIPALDWLPTEVRLRGLRFLSWADSVMSTTPYALCPPYLVDDPDGASAQIRFARPRRGERATDTDCRALVEHLFPGR